MKPKIEDSVAGYDDRSAEPGVWRFAHARRVRVIVDGADYFELVQQAMLKARQRILLIGWDFDTRIHLTQGRRWFEKGTNSKYPARLGSFILWLNRHRPGLEIRILKWSYSLMAMLSRRATPETQGEVQGIAGMAMGIGSIVAPLLSRFALAYPAVEVQLHLSDRPANLVEQGFDVQIRFGELPKTGTGKIQKFVLRDRLRAAEGGTAGR